MIDGKYHARYKSTGLTKEGEARDYLKKFIPQKMDNINLSDFLTIFYSFKQVSQSTLKLYRNNLKNFLDITGDRKLTDYQLFDFEMFKAKLGLKASTINIHLRSIRSVFSYAIELGYIADNPMKGCKSIKIHEKPVKTFTKEQIKQFKAPDYIYKPFLFGLYSGLRISEICKLKWEDIREDSIIIHHSKSHRLRVIPLTSKLKGILKDIPKVQPFVFLNGNGTENNAVVLSKKMRKYLNKSGLPNLSFHSLRHTYATSLRDPAKAQRLLGHSDIRTTMVYIDPSIEDLRGEAERVDFGI